MKRILALVLAVTLLLSLFVAPVAAEGGEISFEPAPSVNLTAVSYVVKSHTYISDTGAITSAKPNELLAVKLTLTNNAEKTLNWAGGQFFIKYDETAFEPYSFTYEDKDTGEEISVGPIARALPKENNGFNYNSKWIGSENVDVPGLIQFTKASAEGQKAINKNESITIAYILFKVKAGAENGVQKFEFDTTRPNAVSAAEEINTASSNIAGIDFSEIHTDNVSVVEGAAPTLAATSVSKNEVVYGSDEVLTMGATSTSNKDITSFVTFKVKDAEGNDAAGFVVNNGNELNVTAADAGTYTVTAEPNGDNCRIDESVTVQNATFTITKQEITAPVVAISNFAKGQLVSGLTVETATSGLSVSATCFDEDGNQLEEERFKAGTTYSISIVLKADKNHVLNAQTLTVTVNGGEPQTVAIEESGFAGAYKAVVTATTADKDAPTITPNPINATYGDKLFTHTPTGTAIYDGQNVSGTFTWSNKYNAETTVGNAGVNEFDVVFTPTNTDLYATVTGTVTVTVAKKQITFTKSDYKWRASNNETPTEVKDDGEIVFTYDGKEHGIEAYCDNSEIADYVEIVYDSGERSFTSSKGSTVTAHVEVKDKKNYELDGGPNIQSGFIRILPIVVNYDGEYTHSVDVCYTTSSVDIPLSAFGLPDEVLNDTNNKYWMRTDAVVAGDVDVISGTPTSFVEATRTLTLNLKSSLTKDDAGKTASVTLGLKVNNYETTNLGVEGIANKEEKLFILKLNVKIIEKENAGLTITGIPESLVYGESAEWSYDVTNPGENGQISGSVTPAGILNNDPHKLTAIGVGEATVTITYSSDTTYAQEKFTITVTPKPLTAAVSHDPITYGDPTPTEGYTVTFNGLLTGDVLADTDYTVGTAYKQGDPVGKYVFTCVLKSETIKNYKLDTVTGELVVNKKELTDGDVTVTVLGETPVYDGSEKKPAVEVKYGETTLAAADYTVSYSNNVNAGVNTASVTVTSNDNSSYKFTATKNFTIAQAPISGAMIADIVDVTYNTRTHTPDVTVTFNGSTLEAGKDYDVAYTNNINAGTATVTVTGKGNFTGSANTTFTIAKADLNLSVYTISSLCTETEVKTSTLPSNFFLADETETGFSIALTAAGGDAIFTQEPAVVDGENMITYQLNGGTGEATFNVTVTPVSSNYKAGTYDLKIQAYDKTNVSNRIVFESGSAVYTGSGIKYEKATIAGHSSGMRYTYAPDVATGATLDAAALPLTVGTYTVTATYSDASSYGYKTATFTITKATPAGTPAYTKIETSGKTLADTKLTVGTIRPAGTIAWDLPLTTVLKDGKEYAWTFTPTDTHNYTTLTGKLIPYVDDGTDYIPGVIDGNSGSFNFHDVSRFDYFYDAVKWAAENGIASGTGRYTFSPDAVCTRAQTVTFLWRAAGSPMPRYRTCAFTDVDSRDYYYNAVLWAVEQGITTGLTATTFGPDVTVSRGQVATFLYRAASASKPNTFNPFTDVKTTAYNYDAILWAYDNRITTGTSDTTFSPDASCTRAQIVTFLYRYYQGR